MWSDACEAMLKHFEQRGATVKEIVIPDLEAARVAHVVTITTEMNQALERFYDQYHQDYGLDVRLNLALSREFTARDYVQAQRVRARLIDNFDKALAEC